MDRSLDIDKIKATLGELLFNGLVLESSLAAATARIAELETEHVAEPPQEQTPPPESGGA